MYAVPTQPQKHLTDVFGSQLRDEASRMVQLPGSAS